MQCGTLLTPPVRGVSSHSGGTCVHPARARHAVAVTTCGSQPIWLAAPYGWAVRTGGGGSDRLNAAQGRGVSSATLSWASSDGSSGELGWGAGGSSDEAASAASS